MEFDPQRLLVQASPRSAVGKVKCPKWAAGAIRQNLDTGENLRLCRLIILAMSSFLAIAPSWAKCPFVAYAVEGIVAAEDGKAIRGASVAIISIGEFFPQHPIIATTDDQGAYKTQMRFNTYSGGGVNGDDCFKKPTRASIHVEATGYNPATKVIGVTEESRVAVNFALVRSPE